MPKTIMAIILVSLDTKVSLLAIFRPRNTGLPSLYVHVLTAFPGVLDNCKGILTGCNQYLSAPMNQENLIKPNSAILTACSTIFSDVLGFRDKVRWRSICEQAVGKIVVNRAALY